MIMKTFLKNNDATQVLIFCNKQEVQQFERDVVKTVAPTIYCCKSLGFCIIYCPEHSIMAPVIRHSLLDCPFSISQLLGCKIFDLLT